MSHFEVGKTAGGTYGVHEFFDLLPQCVFAFDRREREVDFLVRSASDIRDEVSEIICFLKLDFTVDFGHGLERLCNLATVT